MSYDDDDGDGDDGADCVDGVDGVDNNLPSVVAATVGVPPGQELDALLDTSKSRRGLNSEQKLKKYFFPPQWVNDTRHGEGELTWVTGRFLRKYWPFSKLMSSGYIQLFLIIKFQTIFV